MKHPGSIAALALALAGAPLALVHAAVADVTKARSAAPACGSRDVQAVDGSSQPSNGGDFRNRSDDTVVRIDRYRIYDAKGNLILDSGAGGMPLSFNGAPAVAAGRSLAAQRGGREPAGVIAGLYNATVDDSSPRPITVKVDWYAHKQTPLREGGEAGRRDGRAGTPFAGFSNDCRFIRVDPGGQ